VALAGPGLERPHRHVHHEAAPVRRRQVQLVDVRDVLAVADDEGSPHRLQEGLGEHGVEGAAQHLLPRPGEEGLHGAVPAHHPAFEVEDHDPGVEALQDVLVVLLEPSQLVRLLAQAPVEPTVHDRGRGLRGQGLEGVDLLAVQGIEAVLPPHPEDRDHLTFHPAREEPGEAGAGEGGRLAGS